MIAQIVVNWTVNWATSSAPEWLVLGFWLAVTVTAIVALFKPESFRYENAPANQVRFLAGLMAFGGGVAVWDQLERWSR